jgi:hypothetical protein
LPPSRAFADPWPAGLEFIEETPTAPFADDSFDVVVSCLLEHIAGGYLRLREIKRVCARMDCSSCIGLYYSNPARTGRILRRAVFHLKKSPRIAPVR